MPVVAFITAVFNQLDDHKHSSSLWLILSSASNFNTACRVHSLTRRRGSRLDQTIQIKSLHFYSLHPSFVPSSPAFLRLIKSPCLFLGKLTDLNTHIHTHTPSQEGGKKLTKTTLLSPLFLIFHKKWFFALSFPLPCFLLLLFLCISVSSLLAEWQAGFSSWVPLISA